MADYEVIGEAVQDAQKLIQHRPDIPNLLSSDMIPVESAETTAASPFDLTGLMQGADTQIIRECLLSESLANFLYRTPDHIPELEHSTLALSL